VFLTKEKEKREERERQDSEIYSQPGEELGKMLLKDLQTTNNA